MYFSLPTSQERSQHQQQQQQQQQSSHIGKPGLVDTLKGSSNLACVHPLSTTSSSSTNLSNMNYLTDERLLEIVENLEDHWRSPPILTPTTLAMIFNNGYGDTSSPSRSNSLSEKNTIPTASLQCLISQLQKTAALHIPSLEKVIKEDAILGGIRDGSTSIPPLGALDHLTQLLATFNQSAAPPSTSSNKDQDQL